MLTSDYIQLLNNEQLDKKYRDCLRELIDNIIACNSENIETILLYGGLVRDSKAFKNWSDIDIIIIFKDITRRNFIELAEIIEQLESRYSIRIDLSQISLIELIDEVLRQFCYHSEIINAISMRKNVSIVLFGHIPIVRFSAEQEKQAALFYINNTLGLFRRYLVEVAYKNTSNADAMSTLGRIIRWTFSIIRASLRLFDIYTHPYAPSLEHVKQLFPEVNLSLLNELIYIRENLATADINYSIVAEIELFVENYVRLAIRRYYDEINKT